MKLETVVPWGRSLEEYIKMFSLSTLDMKKTILGCGDGPASFNAQLTERGGLVVSVDPVYAFSKAEIEQRIEEVYPLVMELTTKNKDSFVWEHFTSVEDLGARRMNTMKTFLADYEAGKQQGRYVAAGVPSLPFADQQFELAVCSHFLFLYSDNFSTDFHLQSVLELCRVAAEVRVFPLVDLESTPSCHLDQVIDSLVSRGFTTRVETVDYEFQRGGNKMLHIFKHPRTH
jgi:hypothetical protein